MPGFIPLLIWTWHLQAQTAQGMYKVARRLADQAESLSPGPQGRQDQLAGVQVKGDVAGLRLRQPQLLQDPSRQIAIPLLFSRAHMITLSQPYNLG